MEQGMFEGLIPFTFFSAMVLFTNQPFPKVFGGFLERRMRGKNGEVTPRDVECRDADGSDGDLRRSQRDRN